MSDQLKNIHPPLKERQKAKQAQVREEREERLSRALRDNLARRKAQVRGRSKESPDEEGKA